MNKFKAIGASLSVDESVEHDSLILMSLFLSEIERVSNDQGVSHKWIADNIEISASYLSQVFAGYKPLNFKTLAKIQKVLGIKFKVQAFTPGKDDVHKYYANADALARTTLHSHILYRIPQHINTGANEDNVTASGTSDQVISLQHSNILN